MGQSNPVRDTLSVNEAAAYLHVHRKTVIRWADQGRLRFVQTPSQRRRFTRDDLDAAFRVVEPAA